MRFIFAVSGLVEVLARLLAAQRRLGDVGLDSEAVEVVRGGYYDGSGVSVQWSQHTAAKNSMRGEIEAVSRSLAEEWSQGDWEVCLPQVTALLVEFAPSHVFSPEEAAERQRQQDTMLSPAQRFASLYYGGNSRQPKPTEVLTQRLRDGLLRCCAASSQLGLEACWLLQDAAVDASPAAAAWASRLTRECWLASARPGSRDSAALMKALSQASEALAKIDRTKRRERHRLVPFLSSLNTWLEKRILYQQTNYGVRLPLTPLSSGRQLRLLRIDPESSTVMPSRARAPTLLYCEAVDLPDQEQERRHRRTLTKNKNQEEEEDKDKDVFRHKAPPPAIESTAHASPVLRRIFAPCWSEREERMRSTSKYAHLEGWRLASFLVKADDELRREQLAMQAVRLIEEIFAIEHVPGWLRPYQVICTGPRSGLVETLPDAKSLDFVKRNFLRHLGASDLSHVRTVSLAAYFDAAYPSPNDRIRAAHNFAVSLASYSLMTYLLDVKDRHNGNLLIDAAGHVVHIDFSYMLGASPGGIGFESAPFKFNSDFLAVLGGPQSQPFATFLDVLTNGLHALAKHRAKISALLALFFVDQPAKTQHTLAADLTRKFADLDGTKLTTFAVARGLLKEALASKRTDQYDWYQWKTNGIIS